MKNLLRLVKTGIGVRGDYNVIRYNTIFDTVGACVRIGGNEENGQQWGRNNEVRCEMKPPVRD